MKKLSLLAALFVAGCAPAFAFNFNDIVNWTGTGSNEAAMLVDFHDGSQYQSFVWGYRWDGTANGEDMFKAIVAHDPNLSSTITSYSFGDAVSAIGYDGSSFGLGTHSQSGFSTSTQGYWDYYNGDGFSLPTWTESGVGFTDRTLTNQTWDGWSWAANFNSTPPSDTPIAAPQSAPEPGAIITMVGLLAMPALKRLKRA